MLSPPVRHGLLAVLALGQAGPTSAQSSGRPGHGLIGYPITMYQPACAHACRASLPRSSVPCDIHLHGHHSSSVSAECLAESDAYLLSAAWCFHVKCAVENVLASRLERFWEEDLVGRELGQPLPKWTYQESLARVEGDPPTKVFGEEEVFNRTVLVGDEDYLANWNGNSAFERVEINHQKFSLIVLATGVGIPIAFSLLRFLPFPASLTTKFYSYLVDPPAFSKYHAVPVLGLGMIPTRGQAFFIFYIVAINVILSAVGYRALRPNSWYTRGTYEEIFNYVANRTGMLSFANLPLVVLYAGRNNALLWLTSWSHSTFLLLHRWIAVICVLQAAIHSAMWLHIHSAWQQDHAEVSAIPYWYWGIIGTLSLVLLVPCSLLPIRQRVYELFHAMHIVLAVLALVGCWYHIIYRYKRQWGYENWVIMAAVIWGFDWVLRAARVLRRGVKRAFVTRIDDEYVRVDVPGVDCRGHAYAYLPTLTWRVWESHPLSIAGVAYHGSEDASGAVASSSSAATSDEKGQPISGVAAGRASSSESSLSGTAAAKATGISFFVRVGKGTTRLLADKHDTPGGLPVLLEAYSGESRLYEDGGLGEPTAEFPNVIFLAGGVGITAILPKISASRGLYRPLGRKKLYWGVRAGAAGLVSAVESMVVGSGGASVRPEGSSELQWGDVEVSVSVGERFDIRAIIEAEVKSNEGGTMVVVCGPAGMADDVRVAVASLGRHGCLVKLVEETFVW
ncbi:ferric reductase transmembrane component 4 [Colletotrichum musicola]|uniref:Ferric reductase transmembrane component 4 n=1 Tax=Colletotrichum musicola TaxID=2175873 RepID=A0A8H6U162_9PEZI|nr:ferric reductase transmembrane component 4 [Colletotrichum musicola]